MQKNNNLLAVSGLFFKHLKQTESFSNNTLFAYKNDVDNFILFARQNKIENLDDLKEGLILDYFKRIKSKCKGTTLGRNKSSIKKFLNYIRINYKVNLSKPINEIKIEKQKAEYKNVSVEDIEKVIEMIKGKDFFPKRDKAIFLVLYATGIRASELKNLKTKDLNLKNRFIEVKGKFNRRLLFGENIAEVINEYLIERKRIMKIHNKTGKGYLFVERSGKGLTRQSIYLIVKKCTVNAGLNKAISPQILRNSIFIHLLSNGAREDDVKEMLGNKTFIPRLEEVTERRNTDSVYISSHPILLDK
jgi:integrase/recombinase XerD